MVQFYLDLGSPKNINRRPRRVILPSTSAPCGKEQWQVFLNKWKIFLKFQHMNKSTCRCIEP